MKRQEKSINVFKKELQTLTKNELRKAIVLNEVLGKPKALQAKR